MTRKQIETFLRVTTPLFMILEVLLETMIPFLMASIIDKRVNAGGIGHFYFLLSAMQPDISSRHFRSTMS